MTKPRFNSMLVRLVALMAAYLALCLPAARAAPVSSASGNLVFDGVHAFQYDGFGRVVQVNRASLPANAPPEIASLVVGGIVKHYTYDAFGRLIRVQSPFPDPESGGDFGLRVERLYYDGLRRVQEVNIDPSVSMNMAMSGQAGGEMQAAANQVAVNAEEPLDGSAAPATLESQALESEVIPATVTYLAREYVWGPGDWGVDELLAQYDADRRASWPLQDAGGDVIALCDRGGANGTARVITQIVYDAHGAVIDRDDPYGSTTIAGKELRVGHKGLFFDRLDAGISDPMTGQETPRLWPGARLSGYARNRTLHCDFGRWNQPDPNMTGLPVLDDVEFHASSLVASGQSFDLRGHLADGVNVYAYAKGAAWRYRDSTGLSALALGTLGSMAISGNLYATEARVKTAAGANVFLNILFWEQMGLTLIGGGALANSRYGDEVLSFLDEMLGGWSGAMAYGHLSPGTIGSQMTAAQYARHGDPSQWKFQGEKPGSGRPGNEPGDVKYYETWMDAFRQLIEVHYFRDASGAVKEWTIKITGYSP